MMTILSVVTEPNRILHESARELSYQEILSPHIQKLIQDIRETSKDGKYGVGMSAVQVGYPVALSVIAIKPTPNRPNLKPFEKICINTKITETFGNKIPMWEGCCSIRDKNNEPLYAMVPRFKKIKIHYFDEKGGQHEDIVDGFVAHVVQHETDHNNGIMFTNYVDKDDLIRSRDYRFVSKIESYLRNNHEPYLGSPTDIIGFDKVGRSIARTLEPIIGRGEICFFDENIKSNPEFHYLDFEKMFEKSEIMIFTTELPEKYFKNIKQINKNIKIFVPKELKNTIRMFQTAKLEERLMVV